MAVKKITNISKTDKKDVVSKAVAKRPIRIKKKALSEKNAEPGLSKAKDLASRNDNQPLFPKIYRFITERWKLIVAGIISAIIVAGIILQSISLFNNMQEQQRIKAKRGSVEKELSFWKNQLTKYKDARDIYFRIATLEYELGDKEAARVNLEKTLELDPNFKEGREMEQQLGL